MIRNPLRLLAAAAVGLVSWSATASADLLVDPSGGNSINFSSDLDDGMATRSLGGSFKFFGSTIATIGVSVNGSLSTTGTINYGNDAGLGTLTNIIAPYYDDLTLDSSTTGKITEQAASTYYAITWNGLYDHNYIVSQATDTFQAVLFTGNTTLANYQFLAGDIAFAYGSMLAPLYSGTATAGLSGGPSTYVPLPGTTDGQIRTTALLPTGSNFLLFRPNAGNGYDVSTQSTIQAAAVPEPSSWVLLGAGLLLVARLRPPHAGRSLAAIKVPCR